MEGSRSGGRRENREREGGAGSTCYVWMLEDACTDRLWMVGIVVHSTTVFPVPLYPMSSRSVLALFPILSRSDEIELEYTCFTTHVSDCT